MQSLSAGPSSPNAPVSPLHRSFFGGSFFTAAPEEVNDLSSESRRRKSWWGGERDSSLSRKASGIDKRLEKGKQRSDKEKKTKSKGQNSDEKGGAERAEVKLRADSDRVKEEAKQDAGSGKVEKSVTQVEVVDQLVVGNGSLPIGEDATGEVHTMDKQPKAETTGKAGTGEDTARCLREAKSLRSLNSNKSSKDGAKSPKKSWSLMIAKRPPEHIHIPIPSKKLTEDVAGSRFESVKEPEGGRHAGDNPPIYEDGFVSSIS